jgi:hypothetical protein
MTKDEALKLALESLYGFIPYLPLEHDKPQCDRYDQAITAIKAALEAKDEPVKITHKHEWFRTGEMKVGQMRCISCGIWGQEEMPQRTWIGLTDEEIEVIEVLRAPPVHPDFIDCDDWVEFARAIEAKLKEKNT